MAAETASENLPRRLGRYDVLLPLATGTHATVVVGRLDVPGRSDCVAIERISPSLTKDKDLDPFLVAARRVAGLRHPNLFEIRELNSADGELLIVTEYHAGESIATVVLNLHARGETLAPGLAAFVVAEVCAALEVGLDIGVRHDHLTPHDVLIGYDGRIKVRDLGIATALDQISDAGAITARELPYASPERCKGEDLEARSDVFSLGAILWELLSGTSPFARASEADTLRAIIAPEPVVPPESVPRGLPTLLSEIALRTLVRNPSKRYASARALRAELLGFLRAHPVADASDQIATIMRSLFDERIRATEEKLRGAETARDIPSLVPEGPEDDATKVAVPAFVLDAPGVEALLAASTAPPVDETVTKETLVAPAAVLHQLMLSAEPDPEPPPSVVPAPPSGSRRIIAAALGAVAVVVILVVAFRSARSGDAPPSRSTSTPPTGVATEVVAAAPPSTTAATATGSVPAASAPSADREQTTLQIETTPSKANVVVDGNVMGMTPLELKLDKNSEPVEIEIRRAGYQPLKERIVPDMNQRLRLTLVAVAATNAPAPTRAPSANPGPYHRFD